MHICDASEFKYLGCALDESGTDGAECSTKVASGREACDIRSLVNARSLHESLLVPVLTYSSETMIWREKEKSRIRGCTDGQPQRSARYWEDG